MKIGQKLWTKEKGWEDRLLQTFSTPPQLVFAFGGRELMEDVKRFEEIRSFYPGSHIIECSTAGEILGSGIFDDSIAVTAVFFENTTVYCGEMNIKNSEESFSVGQELAKILPKENLIHAMVFSDGLCVNGTALAEGLNNILSPYVSITGGLVADGSLFKKTVVGLDHAASPGKIVIVGFSGKNLKIGYGSFGGWDTFGVERVITKSKNNILYELDGKPALELYKTFLGDKAGGLPSTGLFFPLRMRVNDDKETEVVRTILGINETDQSMTFAGDMPEGAVVALMKANLERLIDGASQAGKKSIASFGIGVPDLAILISCVGRKLVLRERIEEEIEAVKSTIGEKFALTGFYSYGELCPTGTDEKQCRLHNQTMTITIFREN